MVTRRLVSLYLWWRQANDFVAVTISTAVRKGGVRFGVHLPFRGPSIELVIRAPRISQLARFEWDLFLLLRGNGDHWLLSADTIDGFACQKTHWSFIVSLGRCYLSPRVLVFWR